ncbi:type I phosphodiesterase/nucleotide pyrophosphatase [Catenulispora acidiphila DSM 44928]|uniref:Type I phosphodiesterase/nucleotide pyrophosphatase n=1 Tax=Catenulispora acidiphila (strain DSM 44928 / JCM 14897 / NBRC 102108 / NRRL B-24433 / ID139908) TaxID=479433 RepID=C7QHE2_CATAD|nr:alkaline phosphatase family protein [Catenulispora acidiphila]ACU69081.1 type I phosphodiesterase/nucleotide pyrophosphatase [Catenulispora acidiphila DSM 44928]
MSTSRVLVIGIDGTRLDFLDAEPTPNIDRVAGEGFLATVWVEDGTPTVSGPCWATAVTGTTIERHHIGSNDFAGHRLAEHPDFLTVLTRDFGLHTYLAVGAWPPLATPADHGPMFAAPSRLTFATFGQSAQACDQGDETITRDAERILATENIHAAFVYLGANDATAHDQGCGDLYRTAIRRTDARTGRLLAAVASRPDRATENWTFILLTDHGHLPEGGHGGTTTPERTAWIAACGPGIQAGADYGTLRHVDVAAHVYAALGVEPEIVLDGKAFQTMH